jgi:hypothetical protein
MPFTPAPFRRFHPLLYCSLMLLSSGEGPVSAEPLLADWAEVVGKLDNDLPIYTVYVDTSRIERESDIAALWALFDYVTIQSIVGGPWLSSKTRREYDCVRERVRLVGYMTFTGNMGSGEPVYTNSSQSAWEPIAPDSVDRSLWVVACGRRHAAAGQDGS